MTRAASASSPGRRRRRLGLVERTAWSTRPGAWSCRPSRACTRARTRCTRCRPTCCRTRTSSRSSGWAATRRTRSAVSLHHRARRRERRRDGPAPRDHGRRGDYGRPHGRRQRGVRAALRAGRLATCCDPRLRRAGTVPRLAPARDEPGWRSGPGTRTRSGWSAWATSSSASGWRALEGAEIVVTAGPIIEGRSRRSGEEHLGERWLALPIDFDFYFRPETVAAAEVFLADDVGQFEYYHELGHFQVARARGERRRGARTRRVARPGALLPTWASAPSTPPSRTSSSRGRTRRAPAPWR